MSDHKDPKQSEIEISPEERNESPAPIEPSVVSASEVEREEDDETWTNQPASSGTADGHEQGEDDELGDEDEEEEEEAEQAPLVRKPIQNGRDVVCEELPARASRAKVRLRPYLAGTLVIELTNLGEKFLFDWRGEEPKVSPIEGPVQLAQGESSDSSSVECIVSLSEQNLMAVRSGDLNPQLAMLSDKIKVKGKVGPAVYLFNLVAPRERH